MSRWGFHVERLDVREGMKTADYRATHVDEAWVIEVKSRQPHYAAEKAVAAGEVWDTHKAPHDEIEPFMAINKYKEASVQVASTKQGDELGAVWFVLNPQASADADPEQLRCALLGLRRICHRFPDFRNVYGVYTPEFGTDVDVVFLQHSAACLEAILNPWSPRLPRVRQAHALKYATGVSDPGAEIDGGQAWMAPSVEEARRLGASHLKTLSTDRHIDAHEGRERRAKQVELALAHLYGCQGGFCNELFVSSRQIIDDPAEPRE